MSETLFRCGLALACSLGLGCASLPPGRSDLLDFLSDGVTRREDIRLKLGAPSAQYESSRILAYRIHRDDSGYVVVPRSEGWNGIEYSLMLLFGPDGTLARHALIPVRPAGG